MSRISWQMCDIFEVSNRIRDTSSRTGKLSACLMAESSSPTTDPSRSVSPVRLMTLISSVLVIGLLNPSKGLQQSLSAAPSLSLYYRKVIRMDSAR